MPPDHLSATFSALADPTRRAILARLALGETTVTKLAEPFEMTLPAVTSTSRCQTCGLISRGREAQWRPCKLAPKPLREVAIGWSNTAVSGNRISTVWAITSASCRQKTLGQNGKNRRNDMNAKRPSASAMPERTVQHATFVIERSHDASPARS